MKIDTYPADSPLIVAMIKQNLPEEKWGQVLRALRNEPVVWKALKDAGFRSLVEEASTGGTHFWSPGNLALLAIDVGLDSATLINEPTLPLEAEFSKIADQTLKAVITGNLEQSEVLYSSEINYDPTQSLKFAGLIGLALRERYLNEGSWLPVLLMRPEDQDPIWSAALACLFTYTPEPFAFLKSLINPEAVPNRVAQGVHAILSNPIAPKDQLALFHSLLEGFSQTDLVRVLKLLEKQSTYMARTLARSLSSTIESYQPDNKLSPAQRIQFLIEQATLYELASKSPDAIIQLNSAWDETRALQSQFADSLAKAAIRAPELAGHTLEQVTNWHTTHPAVNKNVVHEGNYLLSLLANDQVAEAEQYLVEDTSEPLLLFAKAIHANHREVKDKRTAREYAQRTLAAVLAGPQYADSSLDQQQLSQLSGLLLELNFPYDAIKAAQLATNFDPNNPALLSLLGQAQLIAGLEEQAANSQQVAVLLAPDQIEYRHHYAEALEAAGDWENALVERTSILERVNSPSALDLRALANCALSNGEAQLALEVCQQALQLDPDDGLATSISGLALLSLGNTDLALKKLREATQLSPHHPTPWLNLTKGWQEIGDYEKATDTLRTATHAVPDSADIYFALGKEYDRNNAFTQAVEAYENGARLDPGNPNIALHHGRTLLALGHLQEAKHVVKAAYEVRPGMVDLAYTYAQIMLGLNEPQAALKALVVVIQSEPEGIGPYMEYGRALIKVGDRGDEALSAIGKVLKVEPDNLEAKALFADASVLKEDYEGAITLYHGLLTTTLADETRWRTHLSLGLARASLHLGHYDAAIATLQETVDHDPTNSEIYRCLAEGYAKAELKTDAMDAAREALRLGADDIENLTWFAETAGFLQAEAEALSALKRALELAPGRTDLYVLLGQTQIRTGKKEDAWETFSQVGALQPSIQDLKAVAQGYLSLGDPDSAIISLEMAIQEANPPDFHLWVMLFDAQLLSSQYDNALNSIDQAIELNTQLPDLHLQKAKLLLKMNRPQAAQACLQHALNLAPDEPASITQGIEIFQQIGKYESAMDLAEKFLQLHPEDLGARYRVADLARSLLQWDYASRVLQDGWPLREPSQSERDPLVLSSDKLEDAFSYYCLYGEIFLINEDEIAAAEGLTQALRINETHPRVIALKTRLEIRTGSMEKADELFGVLCSQLPKRSDPNIQFQDSGLDSATSLAIATAALELQRWGVSLSLLTANSRVALNEPFANLSLARLLVIRAETYEISSSLAINKHSPGPEAASDESYHLFKKTILAAQDGMTTSESDPRIERWLARGESMFTQNKTSLVTLTKNAKEPSEIAAVIRAYHRHGDLSNVVEYSREYPHHPQVQLELALALRDSSPDSAVLAAQIAADREPQNPLYLATLALAAKSAEQNDTALEAIEQALALWPDESKWHMIAAKLLLADKSNQDASAAAIQHMQEASQLEPDNPAIFTDLGRVLRNIGEMERSLQALESAVELAPENSDTLYLLAGTYYEKGDLNQALKRVDEALALNNSAIGPHQLRAKIALDQENPYEALSRIQVARELVPSDAKSLRLEAKALSALNRPSEALNSLDNALSAADNPLPLLLERIHLIRKVKGNEAALEELNQLNSGYPDDPEVFALMAHAMVESNQVDEAIFAAKQAIRKGNDRLELKELSELHHLLGRLLRRNGQRDQAIHYLSEAIHLNPLSLEPYLELGRTYLERRDYSEALEIFEKSINISPNDHRSYYQAGLALKENKEYIQSEEMLRKAAELAPNDLRIHRLLGAVVALNIVHNNREAIVEV